MSTFEQYDDALMNRTDSFVVRTRLTHSREDRRNAWDAAMQAERERCAGIADTAGKEGESLGEITTARYIASRIRKGE